MGRSQPFYGLQARGIDGILRPDITVRAVLGKSRGVYERPINVIDNTKD